LKLIETLGNSSAHLIANKRSLEDKVKGEKIADIMALIKGVVEARKKLHIFVNVKEENLQKLLDSLPALKRPTISKLSEEGWFGVNTVIDKNEYIKIVPKLREIAQGLVVMQPKQILPLEELKQVMNK
jgi:ATP phosphoribosyltransferase